MLTWTNPVPYDTVTVVRDGERIADAPGDAASFSDVQTPCGAHTHEVRGVVNGLESAAVPCTVLVTEHPFRRGEINNDGRLDIADPIVLLDYLFGGGREPTCLDAADVNTDVKLDVADAVSLLGYLMGGGAPPSEPFTACGVPDPACSGLGCRLFPACR